MLFSIDTLLSIDMWLNIDGNADQALLSNARKKAPMVGYFALLADTPCSRHTMLQTHHIAGTPCKTRSMFALHLAKGMI
tara:strand:+ start:3013 stop:3249 length:237 start_codon:yes stop_codon:yes gene_type:complete